MENKSHPDCQMLILLLLLYRLSTTSTISYYFPFVFISNTWIQTELKRELLNTEIIFLIIFVVLFLKLI